MKYILSTMTNSVAYAVYDYVGDKQSKQGALPIIRKKIIIGGGANMPSNRSGFGDMSNDADGHPIWTASGIVTPVSDENFAILESHELFKKHRDRGYIKVINHDIRNNYGEVKRQVGSMERKDASAQLTKDTLKVRVNVKSPLEVDQESQFRV
jgi:hypothetical protein